MDEARCFDVIEFIDVSEVIIDLALDLINESPEMVSVTVIFESLRVGAG